jgi:nucleoside 2-deoxyribosyltransferase
MVLKIYVAGKWGDRENISKYIQDIQKHGFEISYDWTKNEIQECRTHEEMSFFAEKDMNGVKTSDVVVLLITDKEYAYRGTFTEMGGALALNKTIFIVDPFENAVCHSNIFYWHPLIYHVKSWKDLLEELDDLKMRSEFMDDI